jgi:hypothetical protein
MIKYKLICKDCDNSFDSWFSSSNEYEKLNKQKFINCNNCNSLNIEKTLMSPSVFTLKKILKKKSIKKSKKQYPNIKNLLKITLIMWVKTLLIK